MASEADISRVEGSMLDMLNRGPISVSNDRELRREVGAEWASVNTVKRAMSRLICDGRAVRVRRQPEERGMGPSLITYRLR